MGICCIQWFTLTVGLVILAGAERRRLVASRLQHEPNHEDRNQGQQ